MLKQFGGHAHAGEHKSVACYMGVRVMTRVKGFCVQISASVLSALRPRVKLQRNGFDFIFLDRIYRIDGIYL